MAFGGTIGYVILYFLWTGRVENVSACACVNVRVCVRTCLLRKEMLVCGAHPLCASSLAAITWGGWW